MSEGNRRASCCVHASDRPCPAAIARGETADAADALDDIAAPSLHGTLRWSGERASAFATLIATARDARPGPVETERAGYGELDLGASWRVAPLLDLRVVVRNATDRFRYGSPDALAAFAPGRGVTISISR